MANTNARGVQYLSDGFDDGVSISKAAAEKSSSYGVTPVVQADAIPAVAGAVNLTTSINAILSVIRDWGLIASA